ncbi:MAG: uroporphyrinogen-III synthase [Mesorhizobium sp.]|nr:uroporphyrinogen-III synthase [Mesorhizobium sp.]MCO5161665.1 uroporphyrinogen-III synthase [Mesorhizobium sp.]
MRRVLVTRPEPGASATALALLSAGFEPVVMPLTEIRPLPVTEIALPAFDAVALTSANAIRHVPKWLRAAILTVPLHAVGAATAQAAREAEFENVVAGPGDAAGLAAAMGKALAPGSAVLYLCGRVRKPEFEQELRGRGIEVIPIETYDTVPTAIADGSLPRPDTNPFFVFVYSAEAAKALAELATRTAGARLFESARLIAVSRRAAAPAEAIFAGRVVVARGPTEAAMIEALSGLD